MSTPVRVNEDNYAELEKEAEQQRRSVIAQLNVILDERYGRYTAGKKVTPAIITPEPKKPIVSDLVGNDTPRTAGDVLADIRELESARDEELRYCQDAEFGADIVQRYKAKIQPLWDEYHELKGEK